MSDKPSPHDGQEGNMLPSSEAVAALLRAKLTSAVAVERIMWLLDQGRLRGMSQAQLAKFAGLDAGTLSKILSGTYPTSLESIAARIDAVRTEYRAEQAQAEKPIVETWVLTEIGKFCDAVCADESIGILTGRSHSGKTTALERYCATRPNVVFLRMPAGGAARIFAQDLAQACGATMRGAYDQVRRNVLRACHALKASVLNKLLSKRLLNASQCSPARVDGRRS